MRAPFLCLAAALFSAAGIAPSAFAQDTLAQESARRQAILARLPADAAKRVFGLVDEPGAGRRAADRRLYQRLRRRRRRSCRPTARTGRSCGRHAIALGVIRC